MIDENRILYGYPPTYRVDAERQAIEEASRKIRRWRFAPLVLLLVLIGMLVALYLKHEDQEMPLLFQAANIVRFR